MQNNGALPRSAKKVEILVLAEGGLMVALAFGLSLMPSISLPFGGTISLLSTLPIIIMSLRHNLRWSMIVAGVYAFAQSLQGMNSVLLNKTVISMLLCIVLDYLVGYIVLGFTGTLARGMQKKGMPVYVALALGVAATGIMRLASSFLSGIIIWRQYAPPTAPVWVYSLGYNVSWCVPDTLVVLLAVLLLYRFLPTKLWHKSTHE